MFFTDMHALKIMYIGAPFNGLPWEARLVGRLDKWNKIRFAFLIESVKYSSVPLPLGRF